MNIVRTPIFQKLTCICFSFLQKFKTINYLKVAYVNVFFVLLLFLVSCESEKKDNTPIKHTIIPEGFVQKSIPFSVFNEKFRKKLDYEQILSPQSKLSEQKLEIIHINIWNNLFNNALLDNELQYLGMDISEAEIEELLYGENVHEAFKSLPFLKDKSGNYSPKLARDFVNKIQNDTAYGPRLTWEIFFEDILSKYKKQKYVATFQHSFFLTPIQQQFFQKYFSKEIDFDYVFRSYQTYVMQTPPDSLVLKLYYNYLDDYFKPEMRRVSYIKATPLIDSAHHIDELKRFTAIRNQAETDFSAFAQKNQEIKYFATEYNLQTTQGILKDFFDKSKPGDVLGPYFTTGSFRYIKVSDKYERPDSVRIRYIALKGENIARANELMIEISAKNNFAEIARKYSVDSVTAERGGEFGWVAYGVMAEPFNTACFSAPEGRYFEIDGNNVKLLMHVMEVAKTAKRFVFAEGLIYELKPNEKDFRKMEKILNKITREAKNSEDLFAYAVEYGFSTANIAIQNTYYKIPDIPNAYEMIEWCFSNPMGKVSPAFKRGNDFFIFSVNEIIPTGLVPISEVIEPLRDDYIILARKDSLFNQFYHQIKNVKNLKECGKILKSDVTSIKNMRSVAYDIPNLGVEGALKGTLYAMNVGNVSGLLKGEKGIFVIQKTAERYYSPTLTPYEKINAQFKADIESEVYLGNIAYVAKPFMNFVRRQDSYYLVKSYPDDLPTDNQFKQQMIGAEFLFRQEQWKDALFGNEKNKGFKQLIDEAKNNSKQLRISKIYAAICYMKLNQFAPAIDLLLTIEPTKDFSMSAMVPMLIADAYSFMGNEQKAEDYYYRAIEQSNSMFFNGLIYLKLLAQQMQANRYNDALNTIQQLQEKNIQSSFDEYFKEFEAFLKWEINTQAKKQ
ncbi:MAG TPA: peptidylprolyl isomerase [Salinivirgaceae bacterium]|mgnify:CR=1 FL=1|nr:peptidylprolyl isomerase [Salinivirgaceae bacterium]